MSPQQLSYISNCIKSFNTEKDWGIASAQAAGHLPDESPDIPETWDLREPWWEIRDQGETGACVGFAVADSVLRWHFVKSNRLQQTEYLSARYLWMASKETDEFTDRPTTFIERYGTSIKAALAIAYKYGVMLEKDLQFESATLFQDDETVFYAIAATRRICSYFNLDRNVNNWRRWIYNKGPIVTRLDPDQSWLNLLPLISDLTETERKSGKLDSYCEDIGLGGHACALVGYTRDRFIVRNSWGTDWGDNGFAYASDSYAQEAFNEAYGVVL